MTYLAPYPKVGQLKAKLWTSENHILRICVYVPVQCFMFAFQTCHIHPITFFIDLAQHFACEQYCFHLALLRKWNLEVGSLYKPIIIIGQKIHNLFIFLLTAYGK